MIFWVPTLITVYVNVIGVFTACGLKYKAKKIDGGSSVGKGKNFYG